MKYQIQVNFISRILWTSSSTHLLYYTPIFYEPQEATYFYVAYFMQILNIKVELRVYNFSTIIHFTKSRYRKMSHFSPAG